MTKKQKALQLAAKLGCEVEIHWDYRNPNAIQCIEVFPPDGKCFEGTLTSLICTDWDDVIDRLQQEPLIECEEQEQ